MKPNAQPIHVVNNLPSEGRRMTIDNESMALIIKMTIDMYSDKELAVMRELSTNAADSHIMAGNQDPIRVSTPSPLRPFLVIQDYGLGLDEEEIYDLFGRIGASTKRESNALNGTFGIGSKAPLTYANQFTMTAVKDGTRVQCSISRDEDGVGRLTVLDPQPTSDPNGVEITIPAKTPNDFDRKAQEFFKYWPSGSVMLNGNDPTGLPENAMWVTDDIAVMQQDRYNTKSVVVMANVPYPAPDLEPSAVGLPYGYGIVAYVPTGSCEIAPTREALADSKRTRATIEDIKVRTRAGLLAAARKEVENAKTAALALKAAQRWMGIFTRTTGKPDFTWNGRPLPLEIRTPKDQMGYMTRRTLLVNTYESGRRGKPSNVPSLNLDLMCSAVFVTGFDKSDATPTIRKKAQQWFHKQPSDKFQGTSYIVFLDWTPAEMAYVDPAHIVPWTTIAAEVLPKQERGASGRIPGSFNLVYGGKVNQNQYGSPRTKDGVPGDDIDQTKPVYYMHGNQREAIYNALPILDHFHDDYTVICLQENRLAKFRRDNPNIKATIDVIKVFAKQIDAKLSAMERLALKIHDERDTPQLQKLAPIAHRIDDPAIQNAIAAAQVDIKQTIKARERFRGMVDFTVPTWENPLDKYRLYGHFYATIHGEAAEELLRYLNNEYAYRTGAKS